jgi:hypothetical protein
MLAVFYHSREPRCLGVDRQNQGFGCAGDRTYEGAYGAADERWPVPQITPKPTGDAVHQHCEEHSAEDSHQESAPHVSP